jgi:mannose-6-phosphate isomerase-like protein (cupin superfamily)
MARQGHGSRGPGSGGLAPFSKTGSKPPPSLLAMTNTYSKTNFADVEEMYAKYGMPDQGQARYLRSDIGAETIGTSLYELRPGKRTGFAHRHKSAEELYVVLSGSGRMKIDDEIIDLTARDVVRVAPAAVREFEAGPDGLELLAAGAHVPDDGEMISDWWS